MRTSSNREKPPRIGLSAPTLTHRIPVIITFNFFEFIPELPQLIPFFIPKGAAKV
jgi:hypothetical protein